MEQNHSMDSKNSSQATTAKDFFLHLGAMIGLYASAIALVNLLFSIIEKAFPKVLPYYYYYSTLSISFPVATLIIVFPIFIFLSYLLEKEYQLVPTKKESWMRRWSIYVTLFISGVILVGDLVAVLYKFLDGQEITTSFILKALVVFGVTALIFGFYIQNIRGKIPGWRKKFWTIFTSVVVIVSIILGFTIIGSPRTLRLMRIDDQKVADLQNIQWQIVNFWQRKGALPETLAETVDPISGWMLPKGPDGNSPYEYKKLGTYQFELCATFNKETERSSMNQTSSPSISVDSYYGKNENWNHTAGRVCFARTIDPVLYPVYQNTPVKGM